MVADMDKKNPYSPAELARAKPPKAMKMLGYDVMSGPEPMKTTPTFQPPVFAHVPQLGLNMGMNK